MIISAVALGTTAVVVASLALAWAGFETLQSHRRLEALEASLRALEARQSRLQRIVEKGWSQSLDLTSFDWSRDSKLPEPPSED